MVRRQVSQCVPLPSAFTICISCTTVFPSSFKTFVEGIARCLCNPGVSSWMFLQIFSSGASNTHSPWIRTMFFHPTFLIPQRKLQELDNTVPYTGSLRLVFRPPVFTCGP